MTRESAIQKGYTHLVKFFGYRCYYNDNTNEITGTNWFSDKMMNICVFFYITVYAVIFRESPFEEYWKIEIIEYLNENSSY